MNTQPENDQPSSANNGLSSVSATADSTSLDRYSRQVRFAPLSAEGQRKLLQARVLVCGCGALGTVLANTLVRAGIGHVRIVDRDFVDLSNLQRQVLFDEDDVAACLPKAVVAAEKLRKVNSSVTIEPIVADVDHTNIEEFCRDVDCIVDGTDNFETRFLINDVSIKHEIPWVYGGCLGASGQTMTIVPGQTPCLRCLMQTMPPPGSQPTCDTAGILASIIGVVASIQAVEAIKILSGNISAINRSLLTVDLWETTLRSINISRLKEQHDCPTCGSRGEFPYLRGETTSHSSVLCGRNSVQLTAPAGTKLSLQTLAQKLQPVGSVTKNAFLLRLAVDQYTLTVFADGRAIIGGTEDVAVARGLYAKYLGL